MTDYLPAAGPFSPFEITRAKRAAEACVEHLLAQVPAGYWVAINLNTGFTDRAAYPTKDSAIGHQVGDRDAYAYLSLPHDGVIEWRGIAAFLRFASNKHSYWRSDPDLHLHVPTAPVVNGADYMDQAGL
ncbi:MAG TPA: hypothetical protein VN375_19215 [Vicinamibacteria bacterium]|jgi:hypothetical protein|nr:hypothetical protein [Vicinamibacteria bacterium]